MLCICLCIALGFLYVVHILCLGTAVGLTLLYICLCTGFVDVTGVLLQGEGIVDCTLICDGG